MAICYLERASGFFFRLKGSTSGRQAGGNSAKKSASEQPKKTLFIYAFSGEKNNSFVLTPVSDIKALAHLLPQGELSKML